MKGQTWVSMVPEKTTLSFPDCVNYNSCLPPSPTGALSKKAFRKETGEAVRRVLPQRQLAACRVDDDQPTLRDDATPAVPVCIETSQVLH